MAVGAAGTVLRSPDSQIWTAADVGATDELVDVASGNDTYVALGELGRAFTSGDGRVWNLQSYGTGSYLNQLGYLNGQFSAVGIDIMASVDGVAWTKKHAGTAALKDICYGKDKYVAVGLNGAVLTSSDGALWSTRISGTSRNLSSVAYGAGNFLAMGYFGRVLISTNGTVWVERNAEAVLGDTEIHDLVFANDRFVAVGSVGGVFTSSNGLIWTKRTSGTTESLSAVTYAGNQLIAVGSNGTLLKSADGVTWRSGRTAVTTTHLNAVARGNGMFVAAGNDGEVLRSEDGVTWAKVNSEATARLDQARFVNSDFWIVGEKGTLMTSKDGVTWSQRSLGISLANTTLRDISFGNETFVAVGWRSGHGVVLSSPDGLSWVKTFTSTNKPVDGVVYAKDKFAVVGDFGTILTSNDGVAWTQRNSGTTSFLIDIAFGNGVFVAVGKGGTVLTSTDAFAWMARTTDTAANIWAVDFGMGTFLATSFSGSFPTILASKDGVGWSEQDIPAAGQLGGISHDARSFLAVGSGGAILQAHVPPATFAEWRAQEFSSTELNQPSVSGAGGDPDGDGIINLLEYAFDLEPKTPSRLGLPTGRLQDEGSGRRLLLSFTRRRTAADVAYSVQVSGDLSHWVEASGFSPIGTNDLVSAERVTLRDDAPVNSAATRFVRVAVTHR
ncbi:MAG: hypothetical protein HYY24_14635 [Verrucomicrobia bacterium]|nr:hypothetical protein [Verrucomicrobiota bacterium]